MLTIFEPFSREALKQAPKTDWLHGWKIQYLAFNKVDTAHLPPIIIVGGAFQNFNSYKFWIEPMLEAGPVILIDLPAMGSNPQIYNATNARKCIDLSLAEIADLFADWLSLHNLYSVSLMGMSLGSVVSSLFAAKYPQQMHRIILLGVMQDTRISWKMVIEESLHLLDCGDMDTFAQAVILYLVNHAKFEHTKMSAMARKMFYEQMASFTPNEIERYHINATRLLNVTHIPAPLCPTLVASGEFDSFTLPFENATYALACPDMQFAVIQNADHLPQLQRRKETMHLFISFFMDKPIDALPGIHLLTRQQLTQLERRREPRIQLQQSQCKLTSTVANIETITANIVNICYNGALLHVPCADSRVLLGKYARSFTLHFSSGLAMEVIAFERQGECVRIIFKHLSFDVANQLVELLAEQSNVRPTA